jgi:hypothetical protein
MRIMKIALLLPFLALGLALGAAEPAGTTAEQGVQITQLTNRLRVEIDGRLLTEYYFKDVPRPFCYPLIGPGEAAMTRDFPMKTTTRESRDHPYHRSFWFAHGDINGQDFWSEIKNFGKTVHCEFEQVQSGKDVGVIKSRNKWVTSDGKVVCTDERTLRFYRPSEGDERIIDFDITLRASEGEVTLGDTKEGTLALRLTETMRVAGRDKDHRGHIVNSAGVRDGQAWGKRADWCDYYGPVDGKIVGAAIFDHPQNPRHPTWWHVRDYGLFAANPFGQNEFENLHKPTAGNLVILAGEPRTFRYRLLLHAGDEQQGKVAQKYQEYLKSASEKR